MSAEKIPTAEVTLGTIKHKLQLSYLFQSIILWFVCVHASNPSTFQCTCGRPVFTMDCSCSAVFSRISVVA